jgi:hypothetical protein
MKRKRLSTVEQPPEGMMWNTAEWIFGNRKFIGIVEFENLEKSVMNQYDNDIKNNPHIVAQMGVSELHKYAMLPWNMDPSYNWRRK